MNIVDVSIHSTPCPEPENTPKNRILQSFKREKAQELFKDFDSGLKKAKVLCSSKMKQSTLLKARKNRLDSFNTRYETYKLSSGQLDIDWISLITVTVVAFVSAFLAIHYFLKLLDRTGMLPYVIYRVILGVVLLAIYY